MKTDIKKKIKKSPVLLNILENKDKIDNSADIMEMLTSNGAFMSGGQLFKPANNDENSSNNLSQFEEVLLNEHKPGYNNRIYKDSDDEFMQMIEEDEEPAFI